MVRRTYVLITGHAVALLTVLVLAAAPSALAAEPLVAQWPLDSHQTSGASDSTADVSGNNLALTSPAGTMQMGTAGGKFGGYLSSANTTVLQASSALLAPAQLTLLAWVKQNGDPGTGHYIAGRGDDAGNCGGSSYALYTGYPGDPDPGLHFYIHSGNAVYRTGAATTASVFDDNWHLVAGTYDGTSIRLYVDGVQVGAPVPAGAINYSLPDSSFYVDGYPYACGGSPNFPGLIDEVRVYDRALTATELGRLAAAPGPTPPDLVPDGGSTTTATSSASASASATATATATPSASSTSSVVTSTTTAAPPPVASFRPIASALAPKGTTILDASQSSGATSLAWDLSGDGKPDVTCPASQPYIALTPQKTITGLIGLQASRGTGLVSSFSQPLTVFNPASASAPAGAVKYGPPSVAVCATSPGAAVSTPLSRVALRPALTVLECTPQTVIAQLISAQGCFVHTTDESNVPPDVRQIVHNDYVSAGMSAVATFYCTRIGQTLSDGTVITQALCDYTKQEFDVHYDVYVSSLPVDLDGITVKPLGGSSIVVYPELQRIIASDALMTWGGAPVRTGEIDLNLGNDVSLSHIECTYDYACGGSQSIARYTGQDLQSIAGFSVDGSVDLALAGINGQRYSEGTVRLKLPGEFALFGGDPPDGTVQVTAQNGTGLQLDSLNLSVPSASIGPVNFTNLGFRYATHGHLDNDDCPGDEWKAQADVFLGGGDGGGTGFELAPPPSQNGIGFCEGSFKNAGGAVMFSGAAAPEIFPGVFLDNINFALQLDPFLVRIGGGVNVGDISRVTGTALLVFPSIGHPYTLSAQDAGSDLAALAGRVPHRHDYRRRGHRVRQLPRTRVHPAGLGRGDVLAAQLHLRGGSGPPLRAGYVDRRRREPRDAPRHRLLPGARGREGVHRRRRERAVPRRRRLRDELGHGGLPHHLGIRRHHPPGRRHRLGASPVQALAGRRLQAERVRGGVRALGSRGGRQHPHLQGGQGRDGEEPAPGRHRRAADRAGDHSGRGDAHRRRQRLGDQSPHGRRPGHGRQRDLLRGQERHAGHVHDHPPAGLERLRRPGGDAARVRRGAHGEGDRVGRQPPARLPRGQDEPGDADHLRRAGREHGADDRHGVGRAGFDRLHAARRACRQADGRGHRDLRLLAVRAADARHLPGRRRAPDRPARPPCACAASARRCT